MADLHFKCLGCEQSLVADECGAGLAFHCPHCACAQEIPHASVADCRIQVPAREHLRHTTPAATTPPVQDPEAARRPSTSGDGNLWVAQERLWQNEHQSAERAIALVEREQRISALTAERDWLVGQLQEERSRREALEPELDTARHAWAAAEKRAGEFEAGHSHATIRLQHLEMEMERLAQQLDVVKSERTGAVLELTRKQETFSELTLSLEKLQAERAELEQIIVRARTELEHRSAALQEARALAEQSSGELEQLRVDLAHVRAELGMTTVQRDKLQSVMQEDLDLADYVATRADRERLEIELKEVQTRFGGLREKLEETIAEREAARREIKEVNLAMARLRDAQAHSHLEQDNEVLRRMVERLNEELKDLRPAGARRKRRAEAGGLVGELARAALARCFVPDPDVSKL